MSEEIAVRPQRRVALLLWLLPLWLAVSAAAGLWYYFHRQAEAAKEEPARFATDVKAPALQDDVSKFLTFVGERHTGGAAGRQGLDRAAAMIEGSLGSANAGYRVEILRGPAVDGNRWPILIVTVRGGDEKAPPLWLVAGYDAPPASPGAELNATGVATTLAAANALANAAPARSVVFAFLPHAYDAESPLMETVGILRERIGEAAQVLVVESTGAARSLVVSSRDADNAALQQTAGLGEVVGAEAICLEDDFDLSSLLFEAGLPAVRVSTRPLVKAGDPDATAPDAAVHAVATKALITLIERLSAS